MTPKEQAAEYYATAYGLDFWVKQFSYSGVVVDDPGLFVLAKPIDSKAPIELIHDSGYRFKPEEWDAWYIQWMSGTVWETLRAMPFPLPLAAFERRDEDKLRIYRIDRLIRFVGLSPCKA